MPQEILHAPLVTIYRSLIVQIISQMHLLLNAHSFFYKFSICDDYWKQMFWICYVSNVGLRFQPSIRLALILVTFVAFMKTFVYEAQAYSLYFLESISFCGKEEH